MKRVIGIGNALTDMLVNLKTDSVLGRFKLAKGSMSLVDTVLQTEISKSVAGLPYSLSLGGSAGNTIRAMAQLGCKVGFIGKVGPDTTGDFFIQALENLGIEPLIFRGKERSGKCVSLISPDGERTMMFRKLLDEAQAGDNIGCLLRGIKREDIVRGQVLAKPGSVTPHSEFVGQVYILTKEEGGRHTPFFDGYRPQFYFRTTDVTGVAHLPEGTEMVMPGDNVELRGELIHPIAMEEGLRFAIREGGRTVGSGRVTQIIK